MQEKNDKTRYVVYDIETLKGGFTYTGKDVQTLEVFQFVIHRDKFQLEKLIEHLRQCRYGIGFNNNAFDYPIIHYILKNYKIWLERFYSCHGDRQKQVIDDIVRDIYKLAQAIIQEQNNDNVNKALGIKEKEQLIIQIDLFKIWHFDNRAKSTSWATT